MDLCYDEHKSCFCRDTVKKHASSREELHLLVISARLFLLQSEQVCEREETNEATQKNLSVTRRVHVSVRPRETSGEILHSAHFLK